MYIAVTRVQAPQEAIERMLQGFKRAAPSMQAFPGCLGLELWHNDTTLEAVSRWESREAVENYARSDLFTRHHPGGRGEGAPSGQGSGQVEYFEGEVVF